MTAARKPRPLNLSSYSELSTLSHCERRWYYQYVEKIRGEQSPAQLLGTLLGLCCNQFWLGRDWRDVLRDEAAETPELAGAVDLDYILEYAEAGDPVATAYWLMRRYEREYADMLPTVKVLGQEIDCRAKIPGTQQTHQAIIDELWKIGRRTYMVERKSFGRNDKADFVDYDPQLTNNLWVARESLGMKIDGIIWDGIYTHRWVATKPTQAQVLEAGLASGESGTALRALNKTEQREWARAEVARHPGVDRPDGDSFQMLWLDRTDKHIAAAQKEIGGVLRRRAQLRKGVQPIRNLGPFCKNCPAQSNCFEDLAFPQTIEVGA